MSSEEVEMPGVSDPVMFRISLALVALPINPIKYNFMIWLPRPKKSHELTRIIQCELAVQLISRLSVCTVQRFSMDV